MIQILWERGIVDPNKSVRSYTVKDKRINKDNNDIIHSLSLKRFIQNLPHFKEEVYVLTLMKKKSAEIIHLIMVLKKSIPSALL